MDLPKFIKISRLSMHMTQAEFSVLFKKPRSNVSKYESGMITPPGDLVFELFNMMFPETISSLHEHHTRFTSNLPKKQEVA